MSGRSLLDTNIVIGLFADEAIIKDNLAQASEIFIPSIVIGELCYGARKSGRFAENLARSVIVVNAEPAAIERPTVSIHVCGVSDTAKRTKSSMLRRLGSAAR
ncbi:MAG: type II toxin-antitoxin system VapC family toxin [Spirulinaceae cyanobacterium RM2_2_10]|nr:type II toxin-antitoxin system VapC family toxin [bacterium]NJO18851.1 type II toxin-antitoxin system VapC family toxin [Spirulinaceae cyanobacterium RM2_2_10]